MGGIVRRGAPKTHSTDGMTLCGPPLPLAVEVRKENGRVMRGGWMEGGGGEAPGGWLSTHACKENGRAMRGGWMEGGGGEAPGGWLSTHACTTI
eukprot:363324-Chlamydomonas_euryale.AAC.23